MTQKRDWLETGVTVSQMSDANANVFLNHEKISVQPTTQVSSISRLVGVFRESEVEDFSCVKCRR